MATTIIRKDVAEDILSGVGALPACSGVQFEFGFPGDETRGELVWLSTVDGSITMPLLSAGRKPRDDTFRLVYRVQIQEKRTIALTFDRLVAVVGAFDDYLANYSTIGEQWAGVVISLSLDTPVMAVTTLPEGPVGIAEVSIEIRSRLS